MAKEKHTILKDGYGYSKIIQDISPLLGEPVRYTEISGKKRTHYYGTLEYIYGTHALIRLDRKKRNYEMYTINLSHILLVEGKLKHVNELSDEELLEEAVTTQ